MARLFLTGFVGHAGRGIRDRPPRRQAGRGRTPLILPDLALVGSATRACRPDAAVIDRVRTERLRSVNAAYKAALRAKRRTPWKLGKGKQASNTVAGKLADAALRDGEVRRTADARGPDAKPAAGRAPAASGPTAACLLWRFVGAARCRKIRSTVAAKRISGPDRRGGSRRRA